MSTDQPKPKKVDTRPIFAGVKSIQVTSTATRNRVLRQPDGFSDGEAVGTDIHPAIVFLDGCSVHLQVEHPKIVFTETFVANLLKKRGVLAGQARLSDTAIAKLEERAREATRQLLATSTSTSV